jgi:hypothetical protein
MIPVHIYLIGVCFMFSLLFVKYKDWTNRYTPIFLLFLLLVESYCYWLKLNHKSNNIEYNFWMPVEFAFYTAIITASFEGIKEKKYFTALIVFYFFIVITVYSFFADIKNFSGTIYLISTILLVFTSLYKMRLLIFKQEVNNPFYEPFFWLIIGLITVHMMGIFQFSATDFLHNKHLSIYRALQKMNIYFTYFQYICMLTYFYTKWKFQK